MMLQIRKSRAADLPAMLAVINDAAPACRGVIPADCWHEPYLPARQIETSVVLAGARPQDKT